MPRRGFTSLAAALAAVVLPMLVLGVLQTSTSDGRVVIPVTGGRLDLGPWQQVFYCEFDGQRSKRLVIKVMGE